MQYRPAVAAAVVLQRLGERGSDLLIGTVLLGCISGILIDVVMGDFTVQYRPAAAAAVVLQRLGDL